MAKGSVRDDGNLAAAVILVLGVTLFHVRGLQPGQTFLPVDLANNSLPWLTGPPHPLQNWLVSDPLLQSYPFLAHTVRTLGQGEWPLWNPYILLGHPSVADPLAQPFYPAFAVLGLLFGVARGLALGLWLHAVLAALLTYGWLRTIQHSPAAAVLGAFTYALSGYMVTWFETTFWISTLTWLPGVLWATASAVRLRSPGRVALAAMALSAAILGGQLSFALAFTVILLPYTLIQCRRLSPTRGAPWWPLGVAATTAILAALLSAVQWVPFLEFLSLSHRLAQNGPTDPLPLQQLVTLLVPDFYGNPVNGGEYWGELNYSEGVMYAGLPALLLALAAPFGSRRVTACGIASVAAVLLYTAIGGPGTEILHQIAVLQQLSLHRLLFLFPLLVAALAALTVDEPKLSAMGLPVGVLALAVVAAALQTNLGQAQQHWEGLRWPLLRAAGLLATVPAILSLRRRFPGLASRFQWSLVALVFLDLYSFGHLFNPVGPIDRLAPPTATVQRLQSQLGLDRVAVYQTHEQLLFGPNTLSIYGLAEAGGYSSLTPARLQQLVAIADPKAKAAGVGRYLRMNSNIVFFNDPSPRLLDLLQAGYLVSPTPLSDQGQREVQIESLYLYQRPLPPRARIVCTVEQIAGEEAAIRRLLDAAFDFANMAVVADSIDLQRQGVMPATPASITLYRNTEIVLTANAMQRGLLVLGDQYYPGWRAYVDGEPATVHRVNQLLRGVVLPQGEHEVVFRFAPESLERGKKLSLVGLLGVLTLILMGRVWKAGGPG